MGFWTHTCRNRNGRQPETSHTGEQWRKSSRAVGSRRRALRDRKQDPQDRVFFGEIVWSLWIHFKMQMTFVFANGSKTASRTNAKHIAHPAIVQSWLDKQAAPGSLKETPRDKAHRTKKIKKSHTNCHAPTTREESRGPGKAAPAESHIKRSIPSSTAAGPSHISPRQERWPSHPHRPSWAGPRH